MITNRSDLPIAALAAAALFALAGLLTLMHEQASPFEGTVDYVIEGVFVAALAAGAAALWQLRERGARSAWTIAAAGHAALMLPAGATFVRGQESLDPLFPLGVLAILLGTLAAAVLDVRGRVAPRGAGIVLLAGWLPALALDTTLGTGVAWAIVALAAAERLRRAGSGTPAAAR
jgi:hypothetical protein